MHTRQQPSDQAIQALASPVVLEDAPCSLCGVRDYEHVYAATLAAEDLLSNTRFQIAYHRPRQHLQILRCRCCQLVQVNPRLADHRNLSHYQEMNDPRYVSEGPSRVAMGRRVVRKIGKWTAPGRMLDIGCAAGYLLQAAREAGWEVEGVEPSRWAIEHARDVLGITVHAGPVEAMGWPGQSFDAIVMSDVIEHLDDPLATLQELHRLLKPGGVLYLSTPRFDCLWSRLLGDGWWGIIPAHNFYFTEQTLQELLDKAGFRGLVTTTASRTFTCRYWLEQGANYFPRLARWLQAAAARLGLLDQPVRLNLGDQIETIASKLGE